MPQKHSVLYSEVRDSSFLDPKKVTEKLNQGTSYQDMSDLLREANDAQFGIVSTLNDKNEWVRDATRATPVEDRISHEDPKIEANNALLRCLSRLRPIDFAIGEKGHPKIQEKMKSEYIALSENILTIAQNSKLNPEEKRKQIKTAEKDFNTFLVQQLHAANLTQGCETEEDAEKLLFHYRNLSSVLAPARTLITLTYDKEAKVFQRETQYPVTKKTEVQREAITQLKHVVPYPVKEQKNSHTSHRVAMQEADSLFADLIAKDDTALSAQARKTHLAGSKNAFIVKNELVFDCLEEALHDTEKLKADEANTLWLGRMGSPVFVGKGESDEVLQQHTRENLEQMREAASERMGLSDDTKMKIHLTTLNTVSPLENQSTIVDQLYRATRTGGSGDDISYVPTNPDGTFRALDIASGLSLPKENLGGIVPLQKASRLGAVSKVMIAASGVPHTISVVNCASGQDRTGTAVEKTTQDWMKIRYAENSKTPDNIEHMRAEGGNAAEMTTHHIHGSPGMKDESRADNFFGGQTTFNPWANREFYRKSAGTNKKNPVGTVDFLKKPSPIGVTKYNELLVAFETNLNAEQANSNKSALFSAGRGILMQVKVLVNNNPQLLSARALSDLSHVLALSNRSLEQSENVNQTRANVRQLVGLANHVSSNHSVFGNKLGFGLAYFACAALVVVGVLAAVPTGGASLLLSAAAVGVGIGIAGYASQKKDLSSEIRNYKKELEKPRVDEPDSSEEINHNPRR